MEVRLLAAAADNSQEEEEEEGTPAALEGTPAVPRGTLAALEGSRTRGVAAASSTRAAMGEPRRRCPAAGPAREGAQTSTCS